LTWLSQERVRPDRSRSLDLSGHRAGPQHELLDPNAWPGQQARAGTGKQRMYDLSDAFIALPGGLGTQEELAEVATWSQLGLHSEPVALLDVDGFWEPLITLLDRMVGTGLLRPAEISSGGPDPPVRRSPFSQPPRQPIRRSRSPQKSAKSS
jgi:Possible lysine decarboxylase